MVSGVMEQFLGVRKLVLKDPKSYHTVVPGVLHTSGLDATTPTRRWAADFIAEVFMNPLVTPQQKEEISLLVLEYLKTAIENDEDPAVVKSVVQAAASIYPFIFKRILTNPQDTSRWDLMMAIKSKILRLWDTAPTGIRICCIKFAQKVVFTQTPAPEIADPKRRDPNDVSVSMVPKEHPIIPPQKLGAEAMGLLDRMLGVFHENATDAVLIDATLNSLSILIRARPSISNKIINAILNFNPLKLANSPMTPKLRVMAKSMEKTTRVLLIHVLKRDPHGPLAHKIQAYIERLMRSRAEIFENQEVSKKRGPPEPTDGLDASKRQKLGANVAVPKPPPQIVVPPLSPGSHTAAELYTVTAEEGLTNFDVSMLPEDLVLKIVVSILSKIDVDQLNQTSAGILRRYEQMTKPATPPVQAAMLGAVEEDDSERDLAMAEDTEQIMNKLDNAPPEPSPDREPEEQAIATFKMPAPGPLSEHEALEGGQGTIARVFGVMQATVDPAGKKNRAGFNRLAAGSYDKEAWITIMTRLATRSSAGLEAAATDFMIKYENGATKPTLSDNIREALYLYVIEDFRRRMGTAISWLCEEWYNDEIQAKAGIAAQRHYEKWALRVLDGMMPYLDGKDKVLTRFLGEIPKLTVDILQRVESLCRDPDMVPLAVTTLLYLVMMRPPARKMALDSVQEIWVRYEDARPMAGKYLSKWRPGFIENQQQNTETGAAGGGAMTGIETQS